MDGCCVRAALSSPLASQLAPLHGAARPAALPPSLQQRACPPSGRLAAEQRRPACEPVRWACLETRAAQLKAEGGSGSAPARCAIRHHGLGWGAGAMRLCAGAPGRAGRQRSPFQALPLSVPAGLPLTHKYSKPAPAGTSRPQQARVVRQMRFCAHIQRLAGASL